MTRPQSEVIAEVNAKRQGHEVYSPRFYDRGRRRICKLFPGYIFVSITDYWSHLKSTRGVLSLVSFGPEQEPATVPEQVIKSLRMREQNGLVQIDNPDHGWHLGDPLRFKDGPFGGLCGLYQGQRSHDRVMVLMAFLGAARMIEAAQGELEAA